MEVISVEVMTSCFLAPRQTRRPIAGGEAELLDAEQYVPADSILIFRLPRKVGKALSTRCKLSLFYPQTLSTSRFWPTFALPTIRKLTAHIQFASFPAISQANPLCKNIS